MKEESVVAGKREANSGVEVIKDAMCESGRKRQRAVKGVNASAISGLWFASVESGMISINSLKARDWIGAFVDIGSFFV